MRAARIHRFGGPDVLQLDEVSVPKPKRDELLVRVHATSLNHIDMGMRRGDLKAFTLGRLPLTLGFDLAGEVVACGAQVTAFAPGDRVFGAIGHRGGATADYACVKQSRVTRVPPTVALTTLAAVPIAGLTALQALRVYARLRPGQRVLVNGASGGVGAFGVALAKLFGGQVTGVCSEAKRDFVLGLGADEVMDYRNVDFTHLNRRWDVVFDAAGNRAFGEVRRVLSPKGVMVTTRLAPRVALSMLSPVRHAARRLVFVPARERSIDLAFLASLIEQGELHVPVDRTFRFEEICAAHQHLEAGDVRGKIVVQLL
jgi:NADPH:quinone reductase-like Zn-dependent oxidoreductase